MKENHSGIDPEISIIMPCYNEEKNIANSIQSILSQDFTDFEFLIIDDCSTDDSAKIIKSFTDERIKYIKNDKNKGISKSLNIGLSISKGKYIARLDSDDVCDSSRLSKQLEYMKKHPKCIVCGSYAEVISGTNKRIQGNEANSKNIKKYLVKNNPFIHSSVMFLREIDEIVIRYPETKGFEDYALWIDICGLGDFHIIPEVLVHRIDNNNFEIKKAWEGFTKKKIYKKLYFFQKKAIRKTGYYFYGYFCLWKTKFKIIVSR